MKKETRLKLMLSLLIGTVFVIGTASCNNNNGTYKEYKEAYKNAARGHKNSSKDGSEYQIKESDKEFYKFYLEEKEVN